MYFFFRAGVIALTLAATDVAAQSTDAARYVNSQGIEVIQPRRPPAPEPGKTGPADKADRTGSVSSAGSATPAAPIDAKLRVSAKDQASRDQDRLDILNQELADETKAFETKARILQTPEMKAKLDDEGLKRLQETIIEHGKNIRALQAEISRVRLHR